MKNQVVIHKDKCIACGLCVKDCPSEVIHIKDNKAIVTNQSCIKCGHCIAICPKDAVEITGLDMSEVKSYDNISIDLNPQELMDFFKSLRTIRKFKDEQINEKIIRHIIEAGRYTATATNRQEVRYIVVRDKIQLLEDMILPKLKFLQKILNLVSKVFKTKYDFSKNKIEEGFVFRKAPLLILIVSKYEIDGALAARSMEIMSRSHGLGGLHVGFFTVIGNYSRKIKKVLGLKKKEKFVACLALGYPDVKYLRTVPRKKANIQWN